MYLARAFLDSGLHGRTNPQNHPGSGGSENGEVGSVEVDGGKERRCGK